MAATAARFFRNFPSSSGRFQPTRRFSGRFPCVHRQFLPMVSFCRAVNSPLRGALQADEVDLGQRFALRTGGGNRGGFSRGRSRGCGRRGGGWGGGSRGGGRRGSAPRL